MRDSGLSILALDPGVTTGIARGKITIVGRKTLKIEVSQEKWELSNLYVQLLKWWQMDKEWYHHLVYEDFVFRSGVGTGAELMPVKLQGVIELFGEQQQFNGIKLWKQNPSVQGDKAFYTNDRLKELGLYVKGKEHGRSATKHLLHWLTFGAGAQFFDVEKMKMELA